VRFKKITIMSISGLKDKELFGLIANDDKRALEVIYNRYSPLLFSVIQKVLNDISTSERLLADIFIIIWKNAQIINTDKINPFVYLVSLTRLLSIDFVRRYRSEEYNKVPYDDEYEKKYILPTILENSESMEYQQAIDYKEKVLEAINNLTEAQGHVLLLAFYGGLTNDEIAESLKIPVETVRGKIKNAIEKLEENFKGTPEGIERTEESKYSDLLPSFAIGSLNREEQTEIKLSLTDLSPEDLRCLAEYQRLIALLSVIIEVAEPTREVKIRIAKKLARIYKTAVSVQSGTEGYTKEEVDKGEETEVEVSTEVSRKNEEPEDIIKKEEEVEEVLSEKQLEEAPETEDSNGNGEETTSEELKPIEEEQKVEEGELEKPLEEVGVFDKKIQDTREELSKEEEDIMLESQKYYEGQLELFAKEDKSQFILDYKDPEDIDSMFPGERINNGTENQKKKDHQKVVYKTNTGIRNIDYLIGGGIALLLVMIIGLFFILQSSLSDISQKINYLPDRAYEKYESVITSVREYVYNRKILDNLLLSETTLIIELKNEQTPGLNNGKLLMDIENRTGFLILKGLPLANQGKVFRLWIKTSNETKGIDLRQSDGNDSFFEAIDLPQFSNVEPVSVLISREDMGSNNPTNSEEVYFSGAR